MSFYRSKRPNSKTSASEKWILREDYLLDPHEVRFPLHLSYFLADIRLDPKLAEEMLHVSVSHRTEKQQRTNLINLRFIDRESFPQSEQRRRDLLHHFNAPEITYSRTCTDLNGYFGCKGTYNEQAKLTNYGILSFEILALLCAN